MKQTKGDSSKPKELKLEAKENKERIHSDHAEIK